MTDVYIIDAVRTPTGKAGGTLAFVRPDDLAAHAINAVMTRNGVPREAVSDVVWGAANQAGEDNRNVARMAALLAGLPVEVPGVTVNRLCGSGMQAIVTAVQAMKDGWGDVMIAGGSESMSRAPIVMAKSSRAFPVGAPEIADSTLGWRFVNPALARVYPPLALGETAEVVAERFGVDRETQDRFALDSHLKAVAATDAGTFLHEIAPIDAPSDPKGRVTSHIAQDEGPRADTSMEALGMLRPVFRDPGTVTAGNASPLSDGAAAVLLATAQGVKAHGLDPIARIVASAVAGVHPDVMGIGPVPATLLALSRAGRTIADVGLIELNEAFAAQSVACIRELDLDPGRVNVNGGAIALGHPLGASGARITTTLVHEMRRRGVALGLATMCIGVGQGISLIIEGT